MSKQQIREWLENNCNTENIVDIIDQYTKEQSAWVSVDAEKPEGPMAVDGYGFIAGGYSHGDYIRWPDIFFDSKKDVWWYWNDNMERVDITGFTMTHWIRPSLPPAQEG